MIALNCTHCGRYLGEAQVFVGELICPNSACKGGTQMKLLNTDQAKLLAYKFATPPRPPKTKRVESETIKVDKATST